MKPGRLMAHNLFFSLLSAGMGLLVAWLLWLLYGQLLDYVGAPMAPGVWQGSAGALAMLRAAPYLPAFIGTGVALGLIAGQVQFWGWLTLERDK